MITIDYKDRRPLYEQIIEKIENLITANLLLPDDQLPPVRQLAIELAINPNTIQRAYSELERKGIIYSVKGRGSFISADCGLLKKRKEQELYATLFRLIQSSIRLNISKEEFLAQCQAYFSQLEDKK